MKVMTLVWIATLVIVLAVAGRSLDQALLASKVAFFGFILGFVGGKVSEGLKAYRESKSSLDRNNRRRK